MSSLRPFSGWTKIPSSLPAYIYIFFTSSLPQNFPSYLRHTSPLLPTIYLPPHAYHLPPPSLHRQSSRDVERERAWSMGAWSRSLELGVGERELGAGEPKAGAGRTWDPGKHLPFVCLFVCLFVYGAALHKIRSAVPQSSSLCCRKRRRRRRWEQRCHRLLLLCVAQEKEKEEGDGSYRRLLLLLRVAKKKKKGNGSYRRLLLLRVAKKKGRRRRRQLSPSFVCFGVALQRSSTKKVTTATVTFFCLLRSRVITQLHEEGNDSYRRLLLPTAELRCSAAPQRSRIGFFCCCTATLQRSEEDDGSHAAVAFFFSCCYATDEGNDSCRHLRLLVLLRCSAAKEGAFFL